jgi:polyhydroxybutyrate depolymerase
MTAKSAQGLMLLALVSACGATPNGGTKQDTDTHHDAAPSSAGDGGSLAGEDAGDPPAPPADAGHVMNPSDGGGPPAQTSTGPGDWGPGDYPPNLHAQDYLELRNVPGQKDKVRGYKVHVPPSYQPSTPMPVVFAFHASNQNAVMYAIEGAYWPDKADQAGFILVVPNGIQEDGFGGSFNAGTCCGAASDQNLDDVALVRAIFAELGTHVNVDLTRVYSTGLSNGADFSYRLACEASDMFAAIAVAAGSVCTTDLAAEKGNDKSSFTCAPKYPMPILHMHGTSDSFVPYASMEKTLAFWSMADECMGTSTAATQPMSGGDTTCVTYQGCPQGFEVTGCSVMNGGHCWFGSDNCGTGAPLGIGNVVVGNNSDTLKATDAAWAFLSRFTRKK